MINSERANLSKVNGRDEIRNSCHVPLVCPNCFSVLDVENEALACPKCQTAWPKLLGIPSFVKESSQYGDTFIQDEKYPIFNAAKEHGWRTAMHETLRISNLADYRAACDESRADLQFLLPSCGKGRILEYGSGWGIISWAVARRAELVVSVDSSLEPLAFLDEKCRQEGVTNIQPVHTDSFQDLPFRNESFDLIIYNGSLSQLCDREDQGSFGHGEWLALAKFFSLLKPGGTIYLGVENRLGYHHFRSLPEDIGRISKNKIVDGHIVHEKTQKQNQQHPQRLKTYWGYKNLLTDVGFETIEFWWPIPHFWNPQLLIPLNEARALFFYLNEIFEVKNSARRLFKWTAISLQRMRLLRYFVPTYGIVAVKGNDRGYPI